MNLVVFFFFFFQKLSLKTIFQLTYNRAILTLRKITYNNYDTNNVLVTYNTTPQFFYIYLSILMFKTT